MWKLNEHERLRIWRDFRKHLDTIELEQALEEAVYFWKSSPFSGYSLDENDKTTWPDPWQIFSLNGYCELAKCLGIVYTVTLTRHGSSAEPEIIIYTDTNRGTRFYLVSFCGGKYVANYSNDGMVNIHSIPTHFQKEAHYTGLDLGLDKI